MIGYNPYHRLKDEQLVKFLRLFVTNCRLLSYML